MLRVEGVPFSSHHRHPAPRVASQARARFPVAPELLPLDKALRTLSRLLRNTPNGWRAQHLISSFRGFLDLYGKLLLPSQIAALLPRGPLTEAVRGASPEVREEIWRIYDELVSEIPWLALLPTSMLLELGIVITPPPQHKSKENAAEQDSETAALLSLAVYPRTYADAMKIGGRSRETHRGIRGHKGARRRIKEK